MNAWIKVRSFSLEIIEKLTNNYLEMNNMDSIVEQRYNNLTDQIDFYFWLHNDNGILSSDQKQHLSELKNTICVFGKRANKWVNLANELLQKNNPQTNL